ncbi:TIGR03943 family putative permease subunit [Halalkalibacter nanhaiisediminis]|uniref:TIGR03943 family putative permease subunit n=1 Tax=Halalkalibacter nanhaiisediminis TaxID=688079 RepID=UPI00346236D5
MEDGAAHGMKENEWVKVKGKLNVKKSDGFKIPTIQLESGERIQPPLDPYIYL